MQHIKKGFTLIELLVVVGIISLVASVGLISMNEAREKARDVKRLADLNELQKLIEFYKSDHNGNPPGQDGVEYVNGVPNWIPGLSPQYIKELPSDPLDQDPYQYHYKREGTDHETAGILEKSSNEAACNDGGSGGCRFFEVGSKLVILNPSEGAWHAAPSSVLTPLEEGGTGTTTPPGGTGGGGGAGTTTTAVGTPTDTILGWFKGADFSQTNPKGTYVHAFYFKYGATVDPNQSFRVYLKRPGETAFTAIATFAIPVSIAPGSCAQTKQFYANGWQIECSTYPYWRVFGPSRTAANYPIGIYYAYVAAVDQSGVEGGASPTTQNHLLAQSLITSPIGIQATTTPTFTWSVPTWSGTNAIYYASVYTATTSIWTGSASVLSGEGQHSILYTGPPLNSGVTYYTGLWGEMREGQNNTYVFTMGNDVMPAFSVTAPAAQTSCPPTITSLTPASGLVGTLVQIQGTCFTANTEFQGTNTANFFSGPSVPYGILTVNNAFLRDTTTGSFTAFGTDGYIRFGIPYDLWTGSGSNRTNVIAGSYRFTITNANGTSAPVEFIVTETPPPPPLTMTMITVTNVTQSSATISWNTYNGAAADPTDAKVEYGTTTAYGKTPIIQSALATSHSITLSGLATGTAYYWRITSKDASGNIGTYGFGDPIFFATQPAPAPQPCTTPRIISLTPSSGPINTTVKIRGECFTANTQWTGTNIVRFFSLGNPTYTAEVSNSPLYRESDGAFVSFAADGYLRFAIPLQLASGASRINVVPGSYQFTVSNTKGTSPVFEFIVTP